MRLAHFAIGLVLMLASLINAQPLSYSAARTYSDTFPERFKVDIPELREYIYKSTPKNLRVDRLPRNSYRYADLVTISIADRFNSGDVYSDWSALEGYVNDVLQKVMPEEHKDNEFIHAYIVKDGTFNAYMTGSGMTFVHLGVFSEIQNEATLAGILAHELAHFHLHHSIEQYVKIEQGEIDPGGFRGRKAFSKYSIQNELDSDKLAMKWLAQAGYHPHAMHQAAEIMNRLHSNLLAQYKNVWEFKESTHPSPERRMLAYDSFALQTHPDGVLYLVNESLFSTFKKEAQLEILKHLLREGLYGECVEAAFKLHIMNPEEGSYVYYLMEAIRQNCYLLPDVWNRNFITWRYYIDISRGEMRLKEGVSKHLFEFSPNTYLPLQQNELKEIEARFYWEDLKFKTNEEAFNFFAKVGELLNEPECLLSNALSLSFDKSTMDVILKKYLTNADILHREFAQNLLDDSIYKSLPNKTLSLMSQFYSLVAQDDDYILVQDDADGSSPIMASLQKAFQDGYPDRDIQILPFMRSQQCNLYTALRDLETFSNRTIVSHSERPKLYILKPEYWETLHRLGVNEIEFIAGLYVDKRKYSHDLEDYKNIVNLTTEKLFSEIKRHRYLEVNISSVRIKKDAAMKIKFEGVEEKLVFSQPAKNQVLDYFVERLGGKDKKAKKVDADFQKYQH